MPAERPTVATASFGQFESHDVDEYTQLIQPWDIRLNQLSRGRFGGTLRAVMTPGMVLYQERWRRQAEVRGSTPSGYVLFGVHLGRRSRFEWCREELGPCRVACARPSTEFAFTAPERSHHAVLLVQPELLARGLGDARCEQLSSGRHLAVQAAASQRLAAAITGVVQRYAERPELLEHPDEARFIEASLLRVLSRCSATEAADMETPSAGRRIVAVRDAIECIEHRLGLVTAPELALAAGVSQRTLEYAFREQLGTTPGAYARIFRLNAARQELANSDSGSTTVSRVGRRWGFGQSLTLRRPRPAAASRLRDHIPGH